MRTVTHATDPGRAVGPPGWVNRLALDILRTPTHRLLGRVCAPCVRYIDAGSGRPLELPVRAEVVGLPECLRARGRRGHPVWLRAAPVRPRVCYVVHGEPVALAALAARIDDELGWCAVFPHQAERVLL